MSNLINKRLEKIRPIKNVDQIIKEIRPIKNVDQLIIYIQYCQTIGLDEALDDFVLFVGAEESASSFTITYRTGLRRAWPIFARAIAVKRRRKLELLMQNRIKLRLFPTTTKKLAIDVAVYQPFVFVAPSLSEFSVLTIADGPCVNVKHVTIAHTVIVTLCSVFLLYDLIRVSP